MVGRRFDGVDKVADLSQLYRRLAPFDNVVNEFV
jgi:hypothetical protein